MSSSGEEILDELLVVLGAENGIVCLVGAGGKKSTIYQIVSRFSGRVAITSTVYTPPFRKRLASYNVVADNEELATRIADTNSRIVAYACPSDKKARLAGVDPGLVPVIHDSCSFDLTLVKADGARLRWLKAPAKHEPALPPRCNTLIPIVSMRSVGESLDHLVAHRPDVVADLVGSRVGNRITADHVARLLAHPEGGMKHAEAAGHVVPIINMVDTEEKRYTARLIADQVLERSRFPDRVVLARMISETPILEVISR